MILLNIFSKIRSFNWLILCTIGRTCRHLLILVRHILIDRKLLILVRYLYLLQYKLLLRLKVRPCRPLLIPGRHLLHDRHLENIRYLLNNRNYLFIVYRYFMGKIIVVYPHLIVIFIIYRWFLQNFVVFWSWYPSLLT